MGHSRLVQLTWCLVLCLACEQDDVSPFVCDPTTQDCPDGKCSYINPTGADVERACVSDNGSDMLGQACTRLFDGILGIGRDTCAPGLFCSHIGELPPAAGGSRYCRATCDADSPCARGEACVRIAENPAQGFCATPCPAFGGTCASGMTCADPWSGLTVDFLGLLTCRGVGTAPTNGPCGLSEDCGADQICVGYLGASTICRALCDSAHPCTAGECTQPDDNAVAGACIE